MDDYITPSVVIVVGIALWRLIHAETESIRSEIQCASYRPEHPDRPTFRESSAAHIDERSQQE